MSPPAHLSIPVPGWMTGLGRWWPAILVLSTLGSCTVVGLEVAGYRGSTPAAWLTQNAAHIDSVAADGLRERIVINHRVDTLSVKMDVVLTLLCANVTDAQLRFPNVRTQCRATGQVP